MKVAIHQPHYLPWPPYFMKIAEAHLFIVLDSVDYQKNGLQNRNQVKTAQGTCWLTVPVRASLGTPLVDVRIDTTSNWARKHWQTLLNNYRKAPAFGRLAGPLEALYQADWASLVDLNLALLKILTEAMGITTPWRRSSEMRARGRASGLVLGLCREVGATTYLCGLGGRQYLDEKSFEEAGIRIEYRLPVLPQAYPQQYPKAGFINHLSVVDLLLNCGADWSRYLSREPVAS